MVIVPIQSDTTSYALLQPTKKTALGSLVKKGLVWETAEGNHLISFPYYQTVFVSSDNDEEATLEKQVSERVA